MGLSKKDKFDLLKNFGKTENEPTFSFFGRKMTIDNIVDGVAICNSDLYGNSNYKFNLNDIMETVWFDLIFKNVIYLTKKIN